MNAALKTYGQMDEGTLQRIRWWATCRAVADIALGDETGHAEYVRAGMRALAWRSPPWASGGKAGQIVQTPC